MVGGGARVHPRGRPLVEPLDIVELELKTGREPGELLVEGDLEAEHRFAGEQVALHGKRAVPGLERPAARAFRRRRSARTPSGRTPRAVGRRRRPCPPGPSSRPARGRGTARRPPDRLTPRAWWAQRRRAARAPSQAAELAAMMSAHPLVVAGLLSAHERCALVRAICLHDPSALGHRRLEGIGEAAIPADGIEGQTCRRGRAAEPWSSTQPSAATGASGSSRGVPRKQYEWRQLMSTGTRQPCHRTAWTGRHAVQSGPSSTVSSASPPPPSRPAAGRTRSGSKRGSARAPARRGPTTRPRRDRSARPGR